MTPETIKETQSLSNITPYGWCCITQTAHLGMSLPLQNGVTVHTWTHTASDSITQGNSQSAQPLFSSYTHVHQWYLYRVVPLLRLRLRYCSV